MSSAVAALLDWGGGRLAVDADREHARLTARAELDRVAGDREAGVERVPAGPSGLGERVAAGAGRDLVRGRPAAAVADDDQVSIVADRTRRSYR